MYLHGQNFELNSMVAVCEQYEVIPSFQMSFLINYHHNCHFWPKTRNYVQTEISEPLVYRLYVRCAITFYLACLTCANQLFLTQGCKLHSPTHPDKVLILLMDS